MSGDIQKVRVRNKCTFNLFADSMRFLTSPPSESYALNEPWVTTKHGCINEGTLTPVVNHLNKWGYINEQRELIVPCIYKAAGDFGCGLAEVFNDNWEAGYIDESGNVAIPFRWKPEEMNYNSRFIDGRAVVCNGSKFGIIDTNGNEISPCQWREVNRYSEGIALVLNTRGLYGYLDMDGNTVYSCHWLRAYDYSGGLAVVKDARGYGAINKQEEEVIPCDRLRVDMHPFSEGMAEVAIQFPGQTFIEKLGRWTSVRSNFKYGYINIHGEMVVPPQYSMTLPFLGGLAGVKPFGEKYGVINKRGELVVPYKWKEMSYCTRHDRLRIGVRYRGKDVDVDYFYDDQGQLIERMFEYVRVKKGRDIFLEEQVIKQSVVKMK